MDTRASLAIGALFAACALLAGCAQSNSELSAAPQPAPAPAAPAPPPAGPVTSEKAKADCWMKYEGDKRVKDIDARLKLVEKCVDDTMRSQPPAR